MIRKMLIAVTALATLATAWVIVNPRPRILFAWGYDRLFLLEPVNQRPIGGYWSHLLRRNDYTANWDGKSLYVHGACFVCGDPYAPKGAFVLALLPNGLAYVKRDPFSPHAHLTAPVYLSRGPWPLWIVFVLLGGSSTMAFIYGPMRRRRRRKRGLCVRCGYNLTGLPEPRCPECGTRVGKAPGADEPISKG